MFVLFVFSFCVHFTLYFSIVYISCCIGDLDYWRDKLQLPNSTSNEPCALCPCNTTTVPWFHFNYLAAWIQSFYNIDTWLASGGGKCRLFTIVGVTVYSLHPDWMHAKHLGTDKVLLASVLYLLVYNVLGGTAGENLKTVWLDILDWYQRLGVDNKFAQLKPTMFSTKSSPTLKGKAGEVKDLVQVLHKVWLKYFNPALEIHRKIEIVLRTSAHMDKVLKESCGEFVLLTQ